MRVSNVICLLKKSCDCLRLSSLQYHSVLPLADCHTDGVYLYLVSVQDHVVAEKSLSQIEVLIFRHPTPLIVPKSLHQSNEYFWTVSCRRRMKIIRIMSDDITAPIRPPRLGLTFLPDR